MKQVAYYTTKVLIEFFLTKSSRTLKQVDNRQKIIIYCCVLWSWSANTLIALFWQVVWLQKFATSRWTCFFVFCFFEFLFFKKVNVLHHRHPKKWLKHNRCTRELLNDLVNVLNLLTVTKMIWLMWKIRCCCWLNLWMWISGAKVKRALISCTIVWCSPKLVVSTELRSLSLLKTLWRSGSRLRRLNCVVWCDISNSRLISIVAQRFRKWLFRLFVTSKLNTHPPVTYL